MKTALAVDKRFKESSSDFVSLDREEKLQGLHLELYQEVLHPYRYKAQHRTVSRLYIYTEEEWNTLRTHHSRMIAILNLITQTPDFYTPGNQAQLDVINIYLGKGLWDMLRAMEWIKKPSASLLIALPYQEDEVLEIVSEESVRILLPNVNLAIATAVAKAEAAKANADVIAAKAETAIARADAIAAKAEAATANERVERFATINAERIEKLEEKEQTAQRDKTAVDLQLKVLEETAKNDKIEFDQKIDQLTQLITDLQKKQNANTAPCAECAKKNVPSQTISDENAHGTKP